MENYNMADLNVESGLNECCFVTCKRGEQTYPLLRQRLENSSNNRGLVLTFPPDQIIDVSFAEATIIRLGEELMAGEFGDAVLLLQGLTEDSIKNIEAIIALRRLKLGFLAVEPTGEWRCIGHLDPSLREILALLADQESITAPQLAKLLKSAVNTASNRLKRLYDRRLIRREYEVSTRGLQYFYYFWQWSEAQSSDA